ncbi:MAG: ubiquinol-cytochrome C chaperone [Alphaproteobacteria bacterium]|nr:ubiquinol-cytochrome C chaperone [Alphaproteobacteria bacterium]
MMLPSLFRKRAPEAAADALYGALVRQARAPWFYRDLGVPDTAEGRFEMIALHGFLVLHRIKAARQAEGPRAEQLGQALFDLMFADMDRNLREMGTGDLGVAKRVKALAKGFLGRIAAYEEGLNGADGDLGQALNRNVFAGSAGPGALATLTTYVRASAGRLASTSIDDMARGRLAFAATEPVPT